ncbi:MAG: hypothetical protein IAE79_22870, partial [Anaerolinea sp.]|nr:hypothetical protein [Anaerolinea sp.]
WASGSTHSGNGSLGAGAPEGAAPEAAQGQSALWRGPAAVLYDNGPQVTHPGGGAGGADASAVQTGLGNSTYGFGHAVSSGFRVADDFEVTGSGWFIDAITFFAYQTGSTTTSTFTGVNLRIWDGPPGDPASNIVFGDTTTNLLASSGWTNMYRVTDTDITGNTRPIMANEATVGVFLPAGTYWLDWQSDGSLASGPWAPPVSILGETGKPGANAVQFDPGAATWEDLIDTGTAQALQDLPFIIEGQTGPFICQTPTDIPWLSLDVTSGTNVGGSSADVTVTFNSAGLATGVYTGTLCVNSNDPVTPLVTVPVTMTVVDPVYGVVMSADMAAAGDVGTMVMYTIQVTNTGNTTDTFDLVAMGGTWTTTLGSSSVMLAMGASASVMVHVAVPADAADGASDVVTITATSQSDPGASDALTLTTTAVVSMRYLYLPMIIKP